MDKQATDSADPSAPAGEQDGRWYVVHALSNYESRVAEALQAAIGTGGGAIKEVLIPTEKVVEMRRGQRREVERRFMPGYVLVRMEMDKVSYHEVIEQPHVIGFLGPEGDPTPLPPGEVLRVQNQVSAGVERPRPSVTFIEGEEVRVIDGPFESFTGQVEEVNEDHARLKVTVLIFGRPTPVELEFGQVQKAG